MSSTGFAIPEDSVTPNTAHAETVEPVISSATRVMMHAAGTTLAGAATRGRVFLFNSVLLI